MEGVTTVGSGRPHANLPDPQEESAMNAQLAHTIDDAPRRLLSVDDLRRMIEAGIIDDEENVELIDGELITMAAKGFAHERIKGGLVRIVNRFSSDDIFVGIEASLRLDTHVLVEPDILVCRQRDLVPAPEGYIGVPAADILLLVEVADTTLRKDRGRKAKLYARYAVPEYWIVDTNTRVIWRHRAPDLTGYTSIDKFGAGEVLTPEAFELAEVVVDLAAFG